MRIAAIVPALDEEGAVGAVVRDLIQAAAEGPDELQVIVVDNGSRDATADRARAAGARVVVETERGYGAACLAGLAALSLDPPEVVLFVDADGSVHVEELDRLLAPLRDGSAELVIGSRIRKADPGALTVPQRFGNVLATQLINRLYGSGFTDLGPFRAIRWSTLQSLKMRDRDYGWTVEMQLEAARRGVPTAEVDVRYRTRVAGRSKVAGTVRGVIGAGTKILWTIGLRSLRPPR